MPTLDPIPTLGPIGPQSSVRPTAAPGLNRCKPDANNQKRGISPDEARLGYSVMAQTKPQQQVSKAALGQIGLTASLLIDLTSARQRVLTRMEDEVGQIHLLADKTFQQMTSEIKQLLGTPRGKVQAKIDEFGCRFASVMLTHSTLTGNLATNMLLALRELYVLTPRDTDNLGMTAIVPRHDLTEQVQTLIHTLLSEFPKTKNLFKFGPDAYAITDMPTLDAGALEKAIQQAEALHDTLCSDRVLLAADPNDPVFAQIKGAITAIGDIFGVSEIADNASNASTPKGEAIMPHMILAKRFTETALQGMGASLSYQDFLRTYQDIFRGYDRGLKPSENAISIVLGHGDDSIPLDKSTTRTHQLEATAERRIAGVISIYNAVHDHVKASEPGNTILLKAFERNLYEPLHLKLEPLHDAVSQQSFKALVSRTDRRGLRQIASAMTGLRSVISGFYGELSPIQAEPSSTEANTGGKTNLRSSL